MNTKTTLLAALPLVFIFTALAAVLIISPENLDLRNKAAEPTPALTPQTSITPTSTPTAIQIQPEIACTGLYQPVCGTDAVTYSNECEANRAGVQIAYSSTCITLQTTPSPTPTTSTLPVGE